MANQGTTRRTWLGSPLQRREAIEGYLWISPWLIGFLVFSLGPIIASFYLSLTKYKIGGKPAWLGLENYQTAFFDDKLFWPSIWRTAYFSIASVLLGVFLSLVAAMLLNQKLKGKTVFRALYYLPSLTPVVALTILWQWLLAPQQGLVNYLLSFVGIPGPGWLTSQSWAIPSIILITLWSTVGGGRMIIFLAGLQGVPKELQEAAEMDGANGWQRFRNVTIPLISPVILFNLILGVIGSLSIFSVAYLATSPPGGPNYATWFYMLHLYSNAFNYFQMGYASALAWIFFVFIFILSYLQIKLSDRWVYYEFS
ncbi:MAG TPA: sugar ABC transporter permease [Caldilineaceae bacterium]|nr:sugar ABC transporter permease [Caldilineaceae bacterium]